MGHEGKVYFNVFCYIYLQNVWQEDAVLSSLERAPGSLMTTQLDLYQSVTTPLNF